MDPNARLILLDFCLPLYAGPAIIHCLVSLSMLLGLFLIFYPAFVDDLVGVINLNDLLCYYKK